MEFELTSKITAPSKEILTATCKMTGDKEYSVMVDYQGREQNLGSVKLSIHKDFVKIDKFENAGHERYFEYVGAALHEIAFRISDKKGRLGHVVVTTDDTENLFDFHYQQGYRVIDKFDAFKPYNHLLSEPSLDWVTFEDLYNQYCSAVLEEKGEDEINMVLEKILKHPAFDTYSGIAKARFNEYEQIQKRVNEQLENPLKSAHDLTLEQMLSITPIVQLKNQEIAIEHERSRKSGATPNFRPYGYTEMALTDDAIENNYIRFSNNVTIAESEEIETTANKPKHVGMLPMRKSKKKPTTTTLATVKEEREAEELELEKVDLTNELDQTEDTDNQPVVVNETITNQESTAPMDALMSLLQQMNSKLDNLSSRVDKVEQGTVSHEKQNQSTKDNVLTLFKLKQQQSKEKAKHVAHKSRLSVEEQQSKSEQMDLLKLARKPASVVTKPKHSTF